MRVGKLPSLRSSERVQVFQPGVHKAISRMFSNLMVKMVELYSGLFDE